METSEFMSSEALLSCFFTECENHFRFLEMAHDFVYFSGTVTYRHNHKVIVPWSNSKAIPQPVIACTRYELGDWAIEILYNEDTQKIEHYFYAQGIHRFSVEEMLKAAKKTYTAMMFDTPIINPDNVINNLDNFADLLKKHQKWILSPEPRLIERALVIKEKLMEQKLREKLSKDLKIVSELAAKAYMQKNYKRVIELLIPYKQMLSGGDLKKLNQAKAQIVNSV